MENFRALAKQVPEIFQSFQTANLLKRKLSATNIAYVGGHQSLCLSSDYSTYTSIYPRLNDRSLTNYPYNVLVDPYKTMVFKLIRSVPEPDVISAQVNDTKRERVAEFATEALMFHKNWVWNMKQMSAQLAQWGLLCGSVFVETYPEETGLEYDAAQGDVIVKDGKAYDKQGNVVDVPIEKRKQIRIQQCIRTIWDVACLGDSETGMMDDESLQITRVARTIGYLKLNYPGAELEDFIKEVETETRPLDKLRAEEISEAIAREKNTVKALLRGDDRQVWLYNVYHKPTKEHPNGFYFVQTDKVGRNGTFILLKSGDLPLGVMPLTVANTTDISPDDVVKDSPFNQAVPLQILINLVVNGYAGFVAMAGKPPMTRYKGVKTTSDNNHKLLGYPLHGDMVEWELPAELKEMLRANPQLANVFEPHFMTFPVNSMAVETMLNRLEAMVKNILGQQMANIGGLPQDISGKSLNIQANLDKIGQVEIDFWQDFWRRFYKKQLKAFKKAYPKNQLAYMLAEYDPSYVSEFLAEDIDDSYDINLSDSVGLPSDPTGKIQYYGNLKAVVSQDRWPLIDAMIDKELLKVRAIPSTRDPENDLIEKMVYRITNDRELLARYRTNKGEAMREIASWVNPFQTHEKHFQYIIGVLNSPRLLEMGSECAEMLAFLAHSHSQYGEAQRVGALQEAAETAQVVPRQGSAPKPVGVASAPKEQPQDIQY